MPVVSLALIVAASYCAVFPSSGVLVLRRAKLVLAIAGSLVSVPTIFITYIHRDGGMTYLLLPVSLTTTYVRYVSLSHPEFRDIEHEALKHDIKSYADDK